MTSFNKSKGSAFYNTGFNSRRNSPVSYKSKDNHLPEHLRDAKYHIMPMNNKQLDDLISNIDFRMQMSNRSTIDSRRGVSKHFLV